MNGSCEVCNREREVHVGASPFGPISFAYCNECLTEGAEPEFVLDYLWNDVAGGNIGNLRVLPKTWADGRYQTFQEYVGLAATG